MNLHPTPTRIALLRSIRDDNVIGEVGRDEIWEVGYIVTSRVRDMAKAGWCEPITRDDGELIDWRLTDAGRAVLAAANTDTEEIR